MGKSPTSAWDQKLYILQYLCACVCGNEKLLQAEAKQHINNTQQVLDFGVLLTVVAQP